MNLDVLSYVVTLLCDEARLLAVDTSAQEIWMMWSALVQPRGWRTGLSDALVRRIVELDLAIRDVTQKHFRDSLAKVVTRSGWPAVRRASEALRVELERSAPAKTEQTEERKGSEER